MTTKLRVSASEIHAMVLACAREAGAKDPFGLTAALARPGTNLVPILRRAAMPKSFLTLDPKIAANHCHELLRQLRRRDGGVKLCGATIGFNVAGGICIDRALLGIPIKYLNGYTAEILHYRCNGHSHLQSITIPDRKFAIRHFRGGLAFADINTAERFTVLHFRVEDGISILTSIYELGDDPVCTYVIPDGTIVIRGSTASLGDESGRPGEPCAVSLRDQIVYVATPRGEFAIANRAAIAVATPLEPESGVSAAEIAAATAKFMADNNTDSSE